MANERSARAYETARGNFTAYKQVVNRGYLRAAHLDLLDRALTQVTRYVETRGARGIGRLIVEMPPRHGKTLTTSRLYPTWHLGRNPDTRVMLVSYGATLAYKNSRAARNLIRTPYYGGVFPGVTLAPDSRAVDAWDLDNAAGGVDALGIGGGATGKGAHLLIIDDAVKSRAEAESALIRDRVWDAFTNDLYTRLEPGGAIVIMGTRWQQDDLTGRALNMSNEGWQRLRLPALAEPGDVLGREQNTALWEARYPLERLLQIQEALGEYEFASLYQQRPLPAGGGLFDTAHIKVVDTAPECTRIVRFYDLAVTAKKHSDYTAGIKLGITADEQFVILDVYRAQQEAPDVERAIIQNAHIDGTSCAIRLEAEKAGIVQLQYLLRNPDLRAYTIDAKAPEGDKYTRATPVASRINAGRFSVVRGHNTRALLDEMAVFPQGAHDDMVDALSGAYDMLAAESNVTFAFPDF